MQPEFLVVRVIDDAPFEITGLIQPLDPEQVAEQVKTALREPGTYKVLRWDAGIDITVAC
jgi:hypothetical protein